MIPSLYRDPPFLQKRLRRYDVNGYAFYTVVVEKGRFLMGSKTESDWGNPPSEVDINSDFELGIHLVTQKLWRIVMGCDPKGLLFKGSERPVEGMSWDEICGSGGFFDKLNAQLQQSMHDAHGVLFSLPTEAQWEYAALGGQLHPHVEQCFSGSSRMDEVGWYGNNSGRETHIVGQKQRNVLGLYDMSGNTWEWAMENHPDNYDGLPVNDEACKESPIGLDRVQRGGSCIIVPVNCRVSVPHNNEPLLSHAIGFRLARSLSSL